MRLNEYELKNDRRLRYKHAYFRMKVTYLHKILSETLCKTFSPFSARYPECFNIRKNINICCRILIDDSMTVRKL